MLSGAADPPCAPAVAGADRGGIVAVVRRGAAVGGFILDRQRLADPGTGRAFTPPVFSTAGNLRARRHFPLER